MILHELRLGPATATVRFWRDDNGHSRGEILEHRGPFRLMLQPPPKSLSAGARDRVRAFWETIRH